MLKKALKNKVSVLINSTVLLMMRSISTFTCVTFKTPTKLCSITLDLWLGDIHDILPQWHVPPNEKHGSGLIDAWYLDGFAPSKNPDMWNDALFAQLARLTKPTGTIATFTAAGFVRRALNAAGFTTKKAKGFGKKREMLSARLTELASREHIVQTHTVPYYQRSAQQTSQTPITQVSILGGGIATGCLAYLLTQQGIKVNVYCADSDVAQGASGNDLGGFYPQLNAQASNASQVHASSFVHAKRFYDKLIAQGANFEHDWCGVLLVVSYCNIVVKVIIVFGLNFLLEQ